MKKIIFTSIFFVTLLFLALLINQKGGDATPIPIDKKIDSFSQANDKNEVKKIIQSHNISKGTEAILFLQTDNNLGYALVKNNEVQSVTRTDILNAEDQYKNHVILFGKKEDIENTNLTVTIIPTNNKKQYKHTVELGSGKYYLVSFEIPEDEGYVRIGEENVFD